MTSLPGCHSSDVVFEFSRVSGGKETGKVKFKAFITDYSSTHTPRWNSEFVYARMDPIAIYQGTSRTISISWTVLSEDGSDGKDNMARIEKFLALAYPEFDPASPGEGDNAIHINNPPIIKVKFSELIQGSRGVIGYFNSEVSFKPNMEAGFLHYRKHMIPKEVNLSCTIQVLREVKDLGALTTKGERITEAKGSGKDADHRKPGSKPTPPTGPKDDAGDPIEKKPIADPPSELDAWNDAAGDIIDARAAEEARKQGKRAAEVQKRIEDPEYDQNVRSKEQEEKNKAEMEAAERQSAHFRKWNAARHYPGTGRRSSLGWKPKIKKKLP